MPTDTTIIDRLREIGDRLANAAWAQTCHDAAEALERAHNESVHLRNAYNEAHDALTAAHAARDAAEQSSHEDTARYMQHMARADAASREARDLRAQLTTALRERDEARAIAKRSNIK